MTTDVIIFTVAVAALAVGAIAGAAIAKRPDPQTQQELDKMKAVGGEAGLLLLGLATAVAGVGVYSLNHPKMGAGILGVGSAIMLASGINAPSGSANRTSALAVGLVGGGLAGFMAWGKPSAQFGASEVVIGYGGMVGAASLLLMSDIARLPNTLPPSTTISVPAAQPAQPAAQPA